MRGGTVADLHVHTTLSDGLLAPAEVVALAASRDLCAVAVTDHDTVAGLAEAAAAGRELGVELVPGVELSAHHGEAVHVVGLFVDPSAEWLVALAARRTDERRRRIGNICGRLRSMGVRLDPAEVLALAGEGSVGRPHVARALVASGAATDVEDAFVRYVGAGRPAYVPSSRLTVEEAIAGIHESGGIAVLGHPGMYRRELPVGDWASVGLDAIECDHPRHDEAVLAAWRGLAAALGLAVSGGSDFHGDGAARAELPGSYGVTWEELQELRRRAAERGGARWAT